MRRLRVAAAVGTIFCLFVAAIAFGASPAPSVVSTLYVDNGNAACTDSGAGSSAQPYCTITAAAASTVGNMHSAAIELTASIGFVIACTSACFALPAKPVQPCKNCMKRPRSGRDPRPGLKGQMDLNKLTLKVDRPQLSPTDIKTLEEGMKKAADAK